MKFTLDLKQLRQMMIHFKSMAVKQAKNLSNTQITIEVNSKKQSVRFTAVKDDYQVVLKPKCTIEMLGQAHTDFLTLDAFLKRSLSRAKEDGVKNTPCLFELKDDELIIDNQFTQAKTSQLSHFHGFENAKAAHFSERGYQVVNSDPIRFHSTFIDLLETAKTMIHMDSLFSPRIDVTESEIFVYGTDGVRLWMMNATWHEAQSRSITRFFNLLPRQFQDKTCKSLELCRNFLSIKLDKLFAGDEVIEFNVIRKGERGYTLNCLTIIGSFAEVTVEINEKTSLLNQLNSSIATESARRGKPCQEAKALVSEVGHVIECEHVTVLKAELLEALEMSREFTCDNNEVMLRINSGYSSSTEEGVLTIITIPEEKDCFFEAEIDTGSHLVARPIDLAFNLNWLVSIVEAVSANDMGWIDLIFPSCFYGSKPTYTGPVVVKATDGNRKSWKLEGESSILMSMNTQVAEELLATLKEFEEDEES